MPTASTSPSGGSPSRRARTAISIDGGVPERRAVVQANHLLPDDGVRAPGIDVGELDADRPGVGVGRLLDVRHRQLEGGDPRRTAERVGEGRPGGARGLTPLRAGQLVLDDERRLRRTERRRERRAPADDLAVRAGSRAGLDVAQLRTGLPEPRQVRVRAVRRDGVRDEADVPGVEGRGDRARDGPVRGEGAVEEADELDVRVAEPGKPVERAPQTGAGRRRCTRCPRSAPARQRRRPGPEPR